MLFRGAVYSIFARLVLGPFRRRVELNALSIHDVRFGSEADMTALHWDVCFAPESGH
jgi:hypothetical protein